MSTFRAAKTIQNICDGQVTNLSLQKLLYLAHMVHMGQYGSSLASHPFEAWDYGPVEPVLYRKLRAYGSSEIPENIFSQDEYDKDTTEFDAIRFVHKELAGAKPARLVSITHWDNGAWARNYEPGVRGIVIPDSDIVDEYNARVERSKKRRAGKSSAV